MTSIIPYQKKDMTYKYDTKATTWTVSVLSN